MISGSGPSYLMTDPPSSGQAKDLQSTLPQTTLTGSSLDRARTRSQTTFKPRFFGRPPMTGSKTTLHLDDKIGDSPVRSTSMNLPIAVQRRLDEMADLADAARPTRNELL